ncbi:unnamed protein product [Miscanthus lutarioriparius]|uniref:RIN4 pathogenic type III effector avirulence factor Avr cleavage site domain-containing protein n=1 Tax=Miscanthus lutarioriparius TaxID=422564 RepID=A0A811MX31_9POAL|nr:unnamed protein product [Miscanthus lutarioriparius]
MGMSTIPGESWSYFLDILGKSCFDSELLALPSFRPYFDPTWAGQQSESARCFPFLQEQQGAAVGWMTVPAFGEWDVKNGAVPDYSMDFSKIREMRKQNKRELSRASLGGDEDLLSSSSSSSSRVARRSRPSPPPPSPTTTAAGRCTTTPLR